MAVNVGRLAATLSLNSSAFNKGLKSAGGGLSGFVSKLGGMKSALAGLAGGLTIAGITSWVKGAADQIETTGKLADELGLTTEELIGFQHAAQLSGVESEAVSSALRKFVRSLDDVGLSGMTTGEALKTIADQIAATDDPSEKAKLAFDAFGKSGQKLISTLSGGSAGLKAMEADARKLGITFSQIDVAQVDAANDAWDRAKKVLTGVAQQIAIQTAPLVKFLADEFVDFATAGNSATAIISEGMINLTQYTVEFASALADIPRLIDMAAIQWAKFNLKFNEFLAQGTSEENTRQLTEGWRNRIEELQRDLDERLIPKTLAERFEQFTDRMKDQLKSLREQLGKPTPLNLGSPLPSIEDKARPAVKKQKSDLIPFTNASPALRGSAEAFNKILSSKQGRTAGITPDGRAITDKLTRVERLLDSILRSQQQVTEVTL